MLPRRPVASLFRLVIREHLRRLSNLLSPVQLLLDPRPEMLMLNLVIDDLRRQQSQAVKGMLCVARTLSQPHGPAALQAQRGRHAGA